MSTYLVIGIFVGAMLLASCLYVLGAVIARLASPRPSWMAETEKLEHEEEDL